LPLALYRKLVAAENRKIHEDGGLSDDPAPIPAVLA